MYQAPHVLHFSQMLCYALQLSHVYTSASEETQKDMGMTSQNQNIIIHGMYYGHMVVH